MPDFNQHLWETEDTGPLDAGGYSVQAQQDASRPSLAGAYSGPGASSEGSGMSGSTPGLEAPPEVTQPPPMTHDQLMSEADKMIHQFQFVPGPSAVQPALDRSAQYADASTPPPWLEKYMATMNRHESERKMLRDLRAKF